MSEFQSESAKKIFEEELFPHLEALKTFAFHLTYNDQDIDKYVEGTNGKAWLFKICKNAYINEYRRKVRRPTKVDYEEVVSYQDSEDPKSSAFTDLRDDLFKDRMGDEVTLALNSLPIDFRTVILLCDIEEFTYEEIAKIIDVPIGTVRSRLFRARNMLKDKLKTYAQKHGYKDYRGKEEE